MVILLAFCTYLPTFCNDFQFISLRMQGSYQWDHTLLQTISFQNQQNTQMGREAAVR
jgi:hypothetical protein